MLMGISWNSGPEKHEGEIPSGSKVYKIANNTAKRLGSVLDWVSEFLWYPGWECVKAIWRNFLSKMGIILGAGGEIPRGLPYECREKLR